MDASPARFLGQALSSSAGSPIIVNVEGQGSTDVNVNCTLPVSSVNGVPSKFRINGVAATSTFDPGIPTAIGFDGPWSLVGGETWVADVGWYPGASAQTGIVA